MHRKVAQIILVLHFHTSRGRLLLIFTRYSALVLLVCHINDLILLLARCRLLDTRRSQADPRGMTEICGIRLAQWSSKASTSHLSE